MAGRKSTSIVRTDAVHASTGKPHFYGEKVQLSDEEAKPLLKERTGEQGVTLFPRHVHLAPRIVKPRLTKWPAGHENGWASIPRAGVGPLPIVSPNHDLELPPWWVTYPNDVPK